MLFLSNFRQKIILFDEAMPMLLLLLQKTIDTRIYKIYLLPICASYNIVIGGKFIEGNAKNPDYKSVMIF